MSETGKIATTIVLLWRALLVVGVVMIVSEWAWTRPFSITTVAGVMLGIVLFFDLLPWPSQIERLYNRGAVK